MSVRKMLPRCDAVLSHPVCLMPCSRVFLDLSLGLYVPPISLFFYLIITQYCPGDKIEKIEMGGTCGTYGGREGCAQGFGGET